LDSGELLCFGARKVAAVVAVAMAVEVASAIALLLKSLNITTGGPLRLNLSFKALSPAQVVISQSQCVLNALRVLPKGMWGLARAGNAQLVSLQRSQAPLSAWHASYFQHRHQAATIARALRTCTVKLVRRVA